MSKKPSVSLLNAQDEIAYLRNKLAEKQKQQVFHIITAQYLGWTETKPSRIVIHSARFKQRVIVSTEKFETAVDWCKANEFNVVGTGLITDRIVIVSDTFKPLK